MTATDFHTQEGWSIRPSHLYKEEYDDCSSIKGRFNQYFIFGKSIDCTQWKKDYENSKKYENSNNTDIEAAKAIIESEKARRAERLSAHYRNNIWAKRAAPPEDWNKKLPEWLEKRNENTFLELKAKELKGGITVEKSQSNCCIM